MITNENFILLPFLIWDLSHGFFPISLFAQHCAVVPTDVPETCLVCPRLPRGTVKTPHKQKWTVV